jgi:hypothetical protein
MAVTELTKAVIALYLAAMVAIIVGLDVVLLRHRFWARLFVNVGVVALFVGLYLRFFKH